MENNIIPGIISSLANNILPGEQATAVMAFVGLDATNCPKMSIRVSISLDPLASLSLALETDCPAKMQHFSLKFSTVSNVIFHNFFFCLIYD